VRNTYDVVIAGGGMVGATLACALGGSRLKVAMIEPQEPPRPAGDYDLRVSAITPASQTVFANLGAWDGMQAQRVAPIEAMRIWEGREVLTYDSADIGEPCLAWIIENRVIVAALAARLGQHANIEVLCPARLAEVELGENTATLRLDSGRALQARLLVGADGAASQVRAAAGIGWTRHDLGQSAIVAVVNTQRPHARTACQHFLPTGPLAFLPLDEPHTVSIVWSADTERAAELMELDDNAFSAELQAAFGDSLGVVSLASARAVIPLALGFAQAYSRHRVALIGDAAHTVHPLAGQGVNLGILDAVTLAELLLGAAQGGRDVGHGALLRRYERARKGADTGMQLVTGGFRYLFGSRFPGVRPLRRAALAVTERLPPLKHFFMRRASGLAGELPVLARRTGTRGYSPD
jgi:2-octaprenylphenol hydroxylase